MANRALLFAAAVLLMSVAAAESVAYKMKIVNYDDGVGGQTSFYSKSGKAVTGPPTAGDTFTFFWTIRDSKNAKIGTDTGSCLYTTSTVNVCTWTACLPGGSITVSGSLDDTLKVADIPIVGGTGKYAGAKGYLTSTAISMTPGHQKYKNEFYLM